MKKAKIICMASAKGGTGKTVISASLASFLAGIGYKTLIIDMDFSTNGLSLFYLNDITKQRDQWYKDGVDNGFGIFEIHKTQVPRKTHLEENIDIIPTSYLLLPHGSLEVVEDKTLLHALDELRKKYDFIIVDAQAGSQGHQAMKYADDIVIVTEYDPISAEGVYRLKRLFPKELTYDKTWILMNKVLPEFYRSLGDFLQAFRFLSPIPWDVEVIRAYSRKKLAIDMDKGNDYTIAIMEIALTLFDSGIEEKVNKWKNKIEESLREPSITKLDKIDKMILELERKKIDTESLSLNVKLRLIGILAFIFFVAIGFPIYSFFIFGTVPETLFMRYVLMLGFPAIAIGFFMLFWGRIKRYMKNEQDQLKLELRMLDNELVDLKKRREKFQVIADSDLEDIIQRKES